MTPASSPGPRVLVVDDSGEMRTIIGRVLGRAGYRVDLASTLGEARKLEPGGYDAILVDACLGADRGTDLIDEVAAADPGMLRRCLVITGGSGTSIPAGVESLKKPFGLDDLLTAVRALHQPEASREPASPEGTETREAGHSDGKGELTAGIPEAGGGLEASVASTSWRLLSLARLLRSRERAGLADFLHDGPIQDLAAASLELQLLRRSAGQAQAPQLDAVLRRLEAVARPLRMVVDEAVPALVTRPQLARMLEQRATWLGIPLAAAANAECAGLTAAEVGAAVDVAELMLLAMTPGLAPVQAEAEVEVTGGQTGIRLTLTPAVADLADADRTAAHQALSELAAALAITMGSEFGRWHWRAWTTVPRAVPGQGNGMAPATLPGSLPSQALPDQALPRPRGLNAVTWP
jgi:DNA-binding response OmpR family regulator